MSNQTAFAPVLVLNLFRVPVENGLVPTGPITSGALVRCIEFRQSNNTGNFRISFNIENSGWYYPNFGFMNMTIHNASAEGILGKANVPQNIASPSFLIGVDLRAGYESGGEPITIFRGLATEIIDAYNQPNDELRFYCTFAPNSVTGNFTFVQTDTLIGAINCVLADFYRQGNSPVPSIAPNQIFPESYASETLAQVRPFQSRKPLPVSGNLSQCLFKIADAWHSRINLSSVGIGVVRTKDNEPIGLPSYLAPGTAIINYTSGLIGSPSYFWNSSQVSFETVLNPEIDFRTLFYLQNLGGTLQGPTGTAININNTRVRNTLGFPKVVNHRGDTRGDEWYTQVTGIIFPSIWNLDNIPNTNFPRNLINCIGR